MKRKIKYSDEPIGKLKIIKDFLPSPEGLKDRFLERAKKGKVKKYLAVLSKVKKASPAEHDRI